MYNYICDIYFYKMVWDLFTSIVAKRHNPVLGKHFFAVCDIFMIVLSVGSACTVYISVYDQWISIYFSKICLLFFPMGAHLKGTVGWVIIMFCTKSFLYFLAIIRIDYIKIKFSSIVHSIRSRDCLFKGALWIILNSSRCTAESRGTAGAGAEKVPVAADTATRVDKDTALSCDV